MKLSSRFLNFFDLNKRAHNGRHETLDVGDDTSLEFRGSHRGTEAPLLSTLSPSRQIVMYLGLLIGVLFSSLVTQFQNNVAITITYPPVVAKLVVSALVALILTPSVYEKLRLDPGAPYIAQFGLFVQNGIFWHVVIASISGAL